MKYGELKCQRNMILYRLTRGYEIHLKHVNDTEIYEYDTRQKAYGAFRKIVDGIDPNTIFEGEEI